MLLVNVAMKELAELKATHVISGMAQGWDQALAYAAIQMKLPWTAAIPFKGQESQWPEVSQKRFHWLCKQAERTIIVSPGGYSAAKMQTRNIWMVDNSDVILALWNGKPGGTGNCIAYTTERGKEIHNAWKAFISVPW
jgi:uncharacterized phage-like protein YoqJ